MRDSILRLAFAAGFLGLILGSRGLAAADPITFVIQADPTGVISGPFGTEPLSGPLTIILVGDTANATENPGSGAFIGSFSAVGFTFPGLPQLFSVDPETYSLSNTFLTGPFFLGQDVEMTYGSGALSSYAFTTDLSPTSLSYLTGSLLDVASADGTFNTPIYGFTIASLSNVSVSAGLGSAPEPRGVKLSTGRASGVGRAPGRTGIAMLGRFLLDGPIDLRTATLTITSLLADGAVDIAGLPLSLDGDPRNTARTAYFSLAAGQLRAKATIRDRGRGDFAFRIEVSGATGEASTQCPRPTLTTAFVLRDGVHVPVVISTRQPWLCSGRNQYLSTP